MRSKTETMNGLPSYNLENLSVLYLEKCENLRLTMKTMLRELGIKNILEPVDISEAPDMVVQKVPDLIITDWAPDFDALKFVDQVRGEIQSDSRFTPIIINSAYSRSAYIKIARDHGISDYLVKPSSPIDIYKRICALIASSRQFVECDTYFGPDRRFQESDFNGKDQRVTPPIDD